MQKLPDGSLFVDADADVFRIILNYMRRPTVYPLLWTREKGFDHAMYSKVMAEADFYMLEELRDWILEKKYLKAVVVIHKTEMEAAWEGNWVYPRRSSIDRALISEEAHGHVNTIGAESVELVKFFPVNVPGDGRYECPKRISNHYCISDCAGVCLPPAAYVDHTFKLPSEKVPCCLVRVWKITKLDMSVCYKK
jgi:hypothetical protein